MDKPYSPITPSSMTTTTTTQRQIDSIPDELLDCILSFINPIDVWNGRKVCKCWYKLFNPKLFGHFKRTFDRLMLEKYGYDLLQLIFDTAVNQVNWSFDICIFNIFQGLDVSPSDTTPDVYIPKSLNWKTFPLEGGYPTDSGRKRVEGRVTIKEPGEQPYIFQRTVFVDVHEDEMDWMNGNNTVGYYRQRNTENEPKTLLLDERWFT